MAVLAFAACSETSPKLVPLPPAKHEKVTNTGGEKYTFNPRVDILFVIDDSGSMSDHQNNLQKNVEKFTRLLDANQILDYHFGVITSSLNSAGRKGGYGKLVGPVTVVDRNTPNGLKTLRENIVVGTSGSATEMFFDPVKRALSAPLITNENKGFYRDDAHLAVIFLTDADDQSYDLEPQTYFQFLVGLKGGDPKKVLHYGAFIPRGNMDCDREGEPEPDRIEEVMTLFGGKSFELCDPDFGDKLADLALDLETQVGRVMYLSRAADPSTIQVTFGNGILPNDPEKGWVYDPAKNAIIFGRSIDWQSQPPGSQIEVNFIAAEYDN